MKLHYVIYLTAFFSSGCGFLGPTGSGTAVFNDAAPTNATVLGQGTLSGLNGKTVSGTVITYSSSGNLIVRLQSLSVPSEAGLQLSLLFANSTTQAATLKGFSGNQNYTFTPGSGGTNVQSVFIKSVVVAPPNNDYGTAVIL